MKLTKCVNGHFYDEEKFESCPHCAGGSKLDVNAIFGGTPSAPKPAMSKIEHDDDMTVPLEWTPAEVPAPETASPAEPEPPAAEPISSVEAEMPAAEPISSVEAEMPVAEPLAPTEATSAEPPVDISEEEEPSSDVEAAEADFDIQSQPSFDTPLDFDDGFTGESERVEEKPVDEPEEEFELFSKYEGDEPESTESEATIETEPLDTSEASAESGSFAEPEPLVESEAPAEPEPFAELEAPAEPEPFGAAEAPAEPEPFVAAEPVAESEPFAAAPEASTESDSFVSPGAFAPLEPTAESDATSFESAGVTWETPQPSVEEIPTGEPVSGVVDPESEDKPTEIVDETDLGPFVMPESAAASIPEPEAMPSSVPSPAAAMFGASADDDDDEHTVAFYDEIFVSKAPATPVVPEAVTPEPAAPSSDMPTGSDAAFSEGTENVPEPDVFTAPPLQPAQALPTPCVGWLIALNGVHIGQDFHLRVGKNYIGRDAGMDVALTGDKSVSRNKHAIVIYEPKHHKYFIQPGESNELVYVNDEVVLLPMPLKPYDVIVIGDIELWFIPLCDEQHNWSEVIRRLQEQM
ncbi:MAG: FHA domain-containing protein [Lachnospiraceae bacterium]|nr:FHA domain-containing protein [Lachnospiraceae bacterium]